MKKHRIVQLEYDTMLIMDKKLFQIFLHSHNDMAILKPKGR
jgi:hypothetical protein